MLNIHSSQTHWAVQPGKEEKMPELFGEISRMGEKKVAGTAEDQQRAQDQHEIHAASLKSDVLSQH